MNTVWKDSKHLFILLWNKGGALVVQKDDDNKTQINFFVPF